jgi:hypothetical protein
MSTMTAVNGAVIEFNLDRILSGRTTYTAKLISGHWPGSEELIELADGGGDFAAYFGGRAEDRPDGTKYVTVHTD